MPKVSDIPILKQRFLALYDKKLISPALFNTHIDRLEALERKEQKRLLSIAKRTNDARLAQNEITLDAFMANWRAICAAREALDAS